jgi:hypothetical protein
MEGDAQSDSGRKTGRSRLSRLLILTWAILWPLLSLAFSGTANELLSRWTPRAVDAVEDKFGLGPLSMRNEWAANVCSGSPYAAYAAPAPALDKLLANSVDGQTGIVDAGGAAFETGQLNMVISATANSTILIEDMRVVLHAQDRRPIEWAVAPYKECGGGDTDKRNYTVDLDQHRPSLRLTSVDDQPRDPNRPFSAFEASASDPTIVIIDAASCKGYYEWGVVIQYSVGGRSYETTVGPPSNPLRSAGGTPLGLFRTEITYDDENFLSQERLVPATWDDFSESGCPHS